MPMDGRYLGNAGAISKVAMGLYVFLAETRVGICPAGRAFIFFACAKKTEPKETQPTHCRFAIPCVPVKIERICKLASLRHANTQSRFCHSLRQ